MSAEAVNESQALEVAENFFFYKNDPRNSSFSYEDISLYSHENNEIFFVVQLNPRGFILVSSDNLIMPILAYSFEENFSFSEVPTNIDYIF